MTTVSMDAGFEASQAEVRPSTDIGLTEAGERGSTALPHAPAPSLLRLAVELVLESGGAWLASRSLTRFRDPKAQIRSGVYPSLPHGRGRGQAVGTGATTTAQAGMRQVDWWCKAPVSRSTSNVTADVVRSWPAACIVGKCVGR